MTDQEQILWRYLDGQCSISERKEIELKLSSDESFKHLHENLSKIHQKLKFTDLDKPSVNFTSKLMEKVATVKQEYEMFSSKRFFIVLFSSIALCIGLSYLIPGVKESFEVVETTPSQFILDFSWVNTLETYSNYIIAIFGVSILVLLDFFFGSKFHSSKIKS